MSTHASITAKLSDGRYASIYLHSDGYLEHAGQMLVDHYTEQPKIDALMALGNLSCVDADPGTTQGHTFNNRVAGYCLAYGRDRGDENEDPGYGPGAIHARNAGPGKQTYNYVWDGLVWFVDGLPLVDKLKQLENEDD